MVTLAADVTPEELQVFLQDTDEQLQLLDEDIIKLENECDNAELLQEIFRAAHTIKGSSAMLGYDMMADLTHAMENILDKLRHGELSVTTEIADALLAGLDDLRVLRGNLTSDVEICIDVSAVINTLEDLASSEAAAALAVNKPKAGKKKTKKTKVKSKPGIVPESDSPTPISEEGRQKILESLSTGANAYRISAQVEEDSPWGAVRFFQILNELGEKGVVITSNPTLKDIEEEKVGNGLELLFVGLLEKHEICDLIKEIPDISDVNVGAFNVSNGAVVELEGTEAELESEDDTNDEDEAYIAEVEQVLETAARETQLTGSTVEKKGSQESVKVSETVRIDVDRLDSLMNQIGELVVARTAFNRLSGILSAKYRDDDDVLSLSKTITNITKIVDDLQIDITEARMMPVGTVFNRFPRLIRDLAQKAGKQVNFIVEGQDTGIDRSVIEHIRDPLVHLLRNAVDHGIETPEDRIGIDKPAKATIRLTAAHEQSYIAITVEDDGKGINGVALKTKAVKNGIISSEAASRIDDYEAVDLIFEAGLSTAEKITDVSGRGVGMDIVKSNIESLNGMIDVETELGKGTKFTLKLPLTLATINGLLISTCGVTFAIPLVAVSETLRLDKSEIQTVTQKEVIRLRERIVPLVRLDEVLNMKREEGQESEMIHIAVVKIGDRMVGLVVDSLKEPQEVVVKSLGNFIGDIKGIAGASILGTGEVALILDVSSLVKLVVMGE